MRRAFFIVCVLGCAATAAQAQSSSVTEWPPRPRRHGPAAAARRHGRAADGRHDADRRRRRRRRARSLRARRSQTVKPPMPAVPKTLAPSPEAGGIKTIDVPAGKTLDSVTLPKGAINTERRQGHRRDHHRRQGRRQHAHRRRDGALHRRRQGRRDAHRRAGRARHRAAAHRRALQGGQRHWEAAVAGGSRRRPPHHQRQGQAVVDHRAHLPLLAGRLRRRPRLRQLQRLRRQQEVPRHRPVHDGAEACCSSRSSIRRSATRASTIASTRWCAATTSGSTPPATSATRASSAQTDVDTFGAAVLGGVNFTRHFHFDLRLKIYYDNVAGRDAATTPPPATARARPTWSPTQGGRCLDAVALGLGQHAHRRTSATTGARNVVRRAPRPARRRHLSVRRRAGSARGRTITWSRPGRHATPGASSRSTTSS